MNAKLVQLSALQCLHLIVPLTLIVLLTLLRLLPSRGPSVAAEPADKTRRAPHMAVRRFPPAQVAPTDNPAGHAHPLRRLRSTGGVRLRFARRSEERRVGKE